jgi:CYTH domain-containing protein
VIDNSTDFKAKLHRTTAAVCKAVGIPEPYEDERRFLVRSVLPPENAGFHWKVADITQDYLITQDGSEARVRQREMGGHRSYTYTLKRRLGGGRAVEEERSLTPEEYDLHLLQRDPQRETIRKRRCYFVWEGQYIELDTFQNLQREDGSALQILEIEVEDLDGEVHLPPFAVLDREITGESDFSNYALAKRA